AHRPDSARHFPDPGAGDLLIASQRIWTAMCRPRVLPTLHALRCLSKRLFEFWEDLEEVADKAVVGDLEDRRFLVLVNGHDHLGVLHASEVLDGAGDAHRDVEIGCDHLARLTNLP